MVTDHGSSRTSSTKPLATGPSSTKPPPTDHSSTEFSKAVDATRTGKRVVWIAEMTEAFLETLRVQGDARKRFDGGWKSEARTAAKDVVIHTLAKEMSRLWVKLNLN